MIALLRLPPKELVDREKEGLSWKFRPEVENSERKLCGSASEFYHEPFFDSEGNISASLYTIRARRRPGEFMHKDLIPNVLNEGDSVPSLGGRDTEEFLNFVQKMLQ